MAKKNKQEKNWEHIQGQDIQDTVKYRDVYGDQQLERSQIEEKQTMTSRLVISIVLAVLISFFVYFVWSFVEYTVGGVSVGTSSSTTATNDGSGDSGSSSTDATTVDDVLATMPDYYASGYIWCDPDGDGLETQMNRYWQIDENGNRIGDETYATAEDVPLPDWYKEALAEKGITEDMLGKDEGGISGALSYYAYDYVWADIDGDGLETLTLCYWPIDEDGNQMGEDVYSSPDEIEVPEWYTQKMAEFEAENAATGSNSGGTNSGTTDGSTDANNGVDGSGVTGDTDENETSGSDTNGSTANSSNSNSSSKKSFGYYMRPNFWKVFVSLLAGLLFLSIFYPIMKRNMEAQNLMNDTSDINQYQNDQHIALPEEVQRKFDWFPDVGAHCNVQVSSMISHMALSNKGLKKVQVGQRAKDDIRDEDGDIRFIKGELLRDDDDNVITKMMPMIDEEFMEALFDASGTPNDKRIRKYYDATQIPYNPDGKDRTKQGGKHKTVADMINADWTFPEYEPQRPAGAYLVDTEPVNTIQKFTLRDKCVVV